MSYPTPVNTLQVFITNRCDRRCRGCFYDRRLGSGDISIEQYREIVDEWGRDAEKVILLGGEPSLHASLGEMVAYNDSRGLRTTVYTNGIGVPALNEIHDSCPSLTTRIGVLGLVDSEKPLLGIEAPRSGFVVYMLRADNLMELIPAALHAKREMGVDDFMVSSIRDIATTGDFWLDTDETISVEQYAHEAQKLAFILGSLPDVPRRLHVSRRGYFSGDGEWPTCRFFNVFPDGTHIICPLDISLDVRHEGDYTFGVRACNKCRHEVTGSGGCLLQKLVLERVQ